MFGIDQRQLLANLRKVRDAVCSYDGHIPCDCKYGAENAGQATEVGPGCPEVLQAWALINAMTPQEFEDLCKRARVRVDSGRVFPLPT